MFGESLFSGKGKGLFIALFAYFMQSISGNQSTQTKSLDELLQVDKTKDPYGIICLADSDYLKIAGLYIDAETLHHNQVDIVQVGKSSYPNIDSLSLDRFCSDIVSCTNEDSLKNFVHGMNFTIMKSVISSYINIDTSEINDPRFPYSSLMALTNDNFKPSDNSISYIYAGNPSRAINELFDKTKERKGFQDLLTDTTIKNNINTVFNILINAKASSLEGYDILRLLRRNPKILDDYSMQMDSISEYTQDNFLSAAYAILDTSQVRQVLDIARIAKRGTGMILASGTIVMNNAMMDPESYWHIYPLRLNLPLNEAKALGYASEIDPINSDEYNHFLSMVYLSSDRDEMLQKTYDLFQIGSPKKISTLISFIQHGDIANLKDILTAKSAGGANIFTTIDDAMDFSSAGGCKQDALIGANEHGLDAKNLTLYHVLGIPEQESFKDTELPNCLTIYPYSDYNGAFKLSAHKTFFSELKKHYDILARVISNRQEIKKYAGYMQNIDLVILGGHGTKNDLYFIEERMATPNFHTYISDKLTVGDSLLSSLDNLNDHCVIFQISCSNGQGHDKSVNLANFNSNLTGKTVYSFDRPSNMFDVELLDPYPFKLRNAHPGRDVLYVAYPDSVKSLFKK